MWVHESVKETLKIRSFEPSLGVLFAGAEAAASLTLQNTGRKTLDLWVGYSMQDGSGAWHDIPAEPLSLPASRSATVTLSWNIPSVVVTGAYRTVMAVWDGLPGAEGAIRLANAERNSGLLVYNHQDTFPVIDTSVWSTSHHTLGRTRLRPDNVFVEDDLLKIRLQEGTYDGGEIRTKELVSFGAYEVRMKLPFAPSSLTGFFHYKAPDYYHEIDIEVLNDRSGTFYLVTYADGKKQHQHTGELPFDPTEDFHNYRIEYYPDHLAFYVDDIFILSYTDGYSHEPMFLMLNCWFPSWLDGIVPAKEQHLEVQWIRY